MANLHRNQKKRRTEEIIKQENLNPEETYKFMQNAFRSGYITTTGTDFAKVLPPISRFTPTGERSKKRERVLNKLTLFFERFFTISSGKI